MTSAFDIGTASLANGQTLNVAGTAYTVSGVTFKPDGTLMYLTDLDGDKVISYSLSTAWDLSTASYISGQLSVSNNPYGVKLKPDGTRMYVVEENSQDVREYNLSTAWTLSTASYSREYNLSSYQLKPREIIFSPDGDKLFVGGIGTTGNVPEIDEFTLTTPWDISSLSHVQNYDASLVKSNLTSLSFNDNGASLFVQYTTELMEIALAA
jgi:DNA-binding beta-propeller fold protein YncE